MPIKIGRDYKCSVYAGSEFIIPKIDDKPAPEYDLFDKRGHYPHLGQGQQIQTNF